MEEYERKLRNRLATVWEPPDFARLFATTVNRKPHKMRKGAILFSEGDPVNRIYYLNQGFVKAYRLSEEGKETINYIVGPNYMIGFHVFLSKDEIAQYNVEAITDIETITMSRDEYFESIVKNPHLLVDLVHAYADRLNYTEKKLEGFVYASTTARIANFLTDCVKRFGQKKGKDVIIPFPLTHQRIADFVGAFRETVTGAVNRLEREGIITVNRGQVIVRDPKKLIRYSLLGRFAKNAL